MKVILLAQIKAHAGCGEIDIPLQQPIHAEELWGILEAKFPGIRIYKSSSRIAVNHEFVESDIALNNGDEVALIPPVSGG